MNGEKLCLNSNFIVESKMGKLHKISLATSVINELDIPFFQV